jgi:integrase
MKNPAARKQQLWPKVSPYRNKDGNVTSFMVDLGMVKQLGSAESKRVRYFYKTLQEAQTKADLCRLARKNEGNNSAALPSRERSDAEEALALVRPHGLSLTHIARFYMDNVLVLNSEKRVSDVVAELLAAKEEVGRADRYLRDLKFRLSSFAQAEMFEATPIHTITSGQIEDWLKGLSSGPVDRNNYRRVLSVLFNFAAKKKYALPNSNPIKDVEIASTKPGKPGILTLDEVRALISASTRDFLPAIVLGLFGGLRPESEVWRLSWENINLEEGLISVEDSKNAAGHRYVKIEENLAQWLGPYAGARGPICLPGEPYFRRVRETRDRAASALEEAGIPADNLRTWPADALRHCYGSYHCTAFGDSRRTSQEMGHSGSLQIFHRHYRNRVKPADALAYWQIVPSAT